MFTFINRYTVIGTPAEFEAVLDRIHQYMAGQRGYLSHRLYRSAKDPRTYVEIAEWDRAESHRSATGGAEFRAGLAEILRLAKAEPGPFIPVSA
ncbi:antibiotic biosynthesis monooxygenase family protein [Amycolatopsis sp. VC5-11]|uniref:antibiotic biosynthesis monooxygenase family protein n=1 Tax=Amycolatopsis sp. VC5-11 TaxID=3120156 RepID=UPI00300BBD08